MENGEHSGGKPRAVSAQRRQGAGQQRQRSHIPEAFSAGGVGVTAFPAQLIGPTGEWLGVSAGRWQATATCVILLVAALSRLLALDAQPLAPDEGSLAWNAWALARGIGGSAEVGPAAVFGSALAFWLFGASDSTARLLPALFGTALVALPLLLQRELGRVGARIAMLLLALSPGLVYYSRMADPAIYAAFGALAVVAGLRAADDPLARHGLYLAAIGAVLLLLSGVAGFFVLAAFVSYAGLRLLAGRMSQPAPVSRAGITAPHWFERPGAPLLPAALRDRAVVRQLALFALAAWVLATTAFLLDLHGIQDGLIDGLGAFVSAFSFAVPLFSTSTLAPPPSAGIYLLLLAAYDLPVFAFGLAGAYLAAQRASAFGGLLTWWALSLVVLGTVSRARPIGLEPLIVVPLALLAGLVSNNLVGALAERRFRVDLGWVALVGGVLVTGALIGVGHESTADPVVPVLVLLVPLVAIMVALGYGVYRFGAPRLGRLLACLTFLALVGFGWRAAAGLAYGPAVRPAEGFVGIATSADARKLATDVGDITNVLSINRRPADTPVNDIFVASAVADPLRWYLRDQGWRSDVSQPNVTVGAVAGSPAIAIVELTGKAPKGAYAGQRYRVLTSARMTLTTWKDYWRWLVYRETPDAAIGTDVTVFVKSAPAR